MIMKPSQLHISSSVCKSILSSSLAVACFCTSACESTIRKPVPPLEPKKELTEKAVTAAIPTKAGNITRMPLGDLYQLVQSNAALIYDVRPAIYHKMGHVPGAISFPKAHFERDLAKHEPQIVKAIKNSTPVVVYCTDLACPDALTVASQLSERGHDVSVLQGGYEAWKAATN
jgi:rhodanese-related sulfurtransferase